MGIAIDNNHTRIVIDGADAIKIMENLRPNKAFKIEFAYAAETDYKPMLTMTIVENDQKK